MSRVTTKLTAIPSAKDAFPSALADSGKQQTMQYAKAKREAPGLLGKRSRRSLNQGIASKSRSSSSLNG